eukprot:sb/3476286/
MAILKLFANTVSTIPSSSDMAANDLRGGVPPQINLFKVVLKSLKHGDNSHNLHDRLQDGHLNTGRTRLYELETISDGIRNPGAFRGLHYIGKIRFFSFQRNQDQVFILSGTRDMIEIV